MRPVFLLLLLVSWFGACTRHHDDIPNEFWDSIALHDSIQLSDSLLDCGLRQAVVADDSLHISLLYFLQGKKFHQDYFLLRAQECYEKSRGYLPAHVHPRLQMELDVAQADLCRFNHFYEREARLLDEALGLALEEKDSLMMVRIGTVRSRRFKEQKDFVRAMDELYRAERYAASAEPVCRAELRAEMAVVHLYMEQADSALADIGRALAVGQGRRDYYQALNKGIRYHMAHNDSALYYFRTIAGMFPLPRKAEAYRYMAEAIGRRGEWRKAFDFLRQHVCCRDSLDADKKAELLDKMNAIREYRKQRLMIEDNERRLTNRLLWVYRLVGVVCLLIVLWGVYYICTRRRQALLNRRLMQAQLSRQEMEIRCLREQEARERLENVELARKVEYFRRLNEITVPLLMRGRTASGALHLSEDDWRTLRDNTDACFDGFTHRLKEAYPQLGDEEIDFCCLVKMELPLAMLAEIYHIAKGSISRKKMRLKEKIGVTDVSFDEFVASF